MQVKTVKAKLPKSVKRITILKSSSAPEGEVQQVVIREKRKRKKKSKGLDRILERVVRRTAEANSTASENYLSHHNSANRKKRNGWRRKLGENLVRSVRKGGKELKLSKVLG